MVSHPVKDKVHRLHQGIVNNGCIRCDARKQLTDEEIAIIGDKCFGTMHYELWLRKMNLLEQHL